MNEHQQTFDAWNKAAQAYESQFMDLTIYKETYDFFLHHLKVDQLKVLEIGCGPGNIARYLIKKRPNLILKGTDLAPKMIERARINVPEAEFIELDCRNITSLKSVYDGIICGFVIPYLSVKERKQLIADCSKLLPNSGVFYLSFVNASQEGSKMTEDGRGNSMRFYYHNNSEIIQDLGSNSFDLLREFTVSYKTKEAHIENHTILIAKRVT